MLHETDQIGFRYSFPLTKILDRLYLGGFKDAEGLALSNPHNITHICNCTQETLKIRQDTIRVIQMDQLDGHDWDLNKVFSAIEWIRKALAGGGTLLIHCHAGISRSPVLTAAVLYTFGFDFDNALDSIKKLRPCVQPAPSILISMKRAFGNPPYSKQDQGQR